MANLINFTKQHWKKLIIASIPVCYGINEIASTYRITKHMRMICEKTKPSNENKTKNVLVVLNPVSNKQKCEKLFRKYCEPLLHLSGYSVDVMKTKYVGHAKNLVESLDKLPDVIVVAGGDGTSSEVVTGLMRRKDESCPIICLPLGEKSATAMSYRPFNNSSKFAYLQYLSEYLLPVTENRLHYANVMKCEIIEDTSSEFRKPIYGLHKFSWGLLKDIEMDKKKYWYFGSFKHYMAALFDGFSNKMNWTISAKLKYSVLQQDPSAYTAPPIEKMNIPFSIFNRHKSLKPNANSRPMEINEICLMEECNAVDVNQIDIVCQNASKPLTTELQTSIYKALKPGFDFIKNVNNIVSETVEPSEILQIHKMEIYPSSSIATSTKNSSNSSNASNISTYYIDGEEYEALPLRISLIPRAIKIFF